MKKYIVCLTLAVLLGLWKGIALGITFAVGFWMVFIVDGYWDQRFSTSKTKGVNDSIENDDKEQFK